MAVGSTKEPFFFYLVACLIYLSLSVVSSIGIWRIDAWASRRILGLPGKRLGVYHEKSVRGTRAIFPVKSVALAYPTR